MGDATERAEALDAGVVELVGVGKVEIVDVIKKMIDSINHVRCKRYKTILRKMRIQTHYCKSDKVFISTFSALLK